MPVRPAKRAVCARLAVLSRLSGAVLLALSGLAAAAPPAVQPLQAAGSKSAAPAGSRSLQLHMQEQLGVPSFLRAEGEARTRGLAKARVKDDPESLARAHLATHAALYRLRDADLDALVVREARTLPNGGSLVRFTQQLDGIEVFREQATVLLGADGGLEAIGGYLLGVEGQRGKAAGAFRLDAREALSRVLATAGKAADAGDLRVLRQQGEWLYIGAAGKAGGTLAEPVRSKPVFYRDAHGLVPAHYLEVALDEGDGAPVLHSYVVSAKSGAVLFRHRLQEDAAFMYRAWVSVFPPYAPYPSPYGRSFTPHPVGDPTDDAAPFMPQELIALESAPFSRGDPWLPDGATVTSGNNVDAYADLVPPDGYTPGDLRPTVSFPDWFDHSYDTGLPPNASAGQIAAATTQLFYTVNWLHDGFYDAGFDEAAGNAQQDNFGRGGLAGDAIRAEAQDYGGLNNANMQTPADGASPRMQMYLFEGADAATVSLTGQVSGNLPAAGAEFGPQAFDITGQVALADPLRACTPITNMAEVAGRIAVVERGDCNFTVKMAAAQSAGAVGVIVFDNQPGAPVGMGGTDPVVIPSLRISQDDGLALLGGLAEGSVGARLRRIQGMGRDGTIDSTIVAHEWGHYISNRLVGNSNGLVTQQSRGMGEGWGDFHALLMMVTDFDRNVPGNNLFQGTYAVGGYALGGPALPGAVDYASYYGFRRYPYSTNLLKNPLSFRHIDDSQPPPSVPPPYGAQNPNSQVHNTGEVWGSMLWECYASLLNAHPFAEAHDRMKRYLVNAYKLTPVAPTFVEARDALLTVALANDPADFIRCANGFAKRGAGAGAIAPPRLHAQNIGVVESYGTGGAVQSTAVSVDDSVLSCDGDGVLDAGERGVLRIDLRNAGFATSAGGQVRVASTQAVDFPDGDSVGFPGIARFELDAVALGIASSAGQQQAIELLVDTEGDGTSHAGSFAVLGGYDIVASAAERFEAGATGWATMVDAGGPPELAWAVEALSPTRHVAHADDGDTVGISWLFTPVLAVGNAPLVIELGHRFRFESDATTSWDGGVIELSSDGGASWQDIADLGFAGYNGTLSTEASNPAGGRDALVGASDGFPGFTALRIDLGTQFAGQNVQLRFGVATDLAVGDHGWDIDALVVSSGIEGTPFQDRVGDQALCHGFSMVSGDGQQVRTGATFPLPLTVQVDAPGGAPQAGYEVVFTLPADGAGARFAGGGSTASVLTGPDGRASSPPVVANDVGGSYQAEARMGANALQFSLGNIKLPDPLFSDGFEPQVP